MLNIRQRRGLVMKMRCPLIAATAVCINFLFGTDCFANAWQLEDINNIYSVQQFILDSGENTITGSIESGASTNIIDFLYFGATINSISISYNSITSTDILTYADGSILFNGGYFVGNNAPPTL